MNNKKNYITKLQRLVLYNSYDGHCAFCGREIDYRDGEKYSFKIETE